MSHMSTSLCYIVASCVHRALTETLSTSTWWQHPGVSGSIGEIGCESCHAPCLAIFTHMTQRRCPDCVCSLAA